MSAICREPDLGQRSLALALGDGNPGAARRRGHVRFGGQQPIPRKNSGWSLLLDRKLVDDLIETRLTLESETAFLAAQRAGHEDLLEIAAAIEGMEQSASQPDSYLGFDVRFHVAIARASQNSILFQLLGMIRGYLQTWIKETLSATPAHDSELRANKSIAEHRKVQAALKAGTPSTRVKR